ncbi:hypothetical protein AO354_38230 [Pseudomonas syringae pv. syringae]|nr:hypothetical protein AO354_38230 [Pseudomonas syringae pv. syringae]
MVDSTVHSRQLNPWLKDMNFQQANILNYTPAPEGYDVLVCSEVLHFFTKDELQQVWLSGFDIVDFSHFFDNQSWPLTDSVSLPIEPYTWQGTYVSVCAKKRK